MKPGGILSSTIEACPFGVVVFIESLGVIVHANSEVERMFGYEHDEFIGQTIDILVPTILREPKGDDFGPISTLSQICKIKSRKLTGCRKDGGKFQVEVGLNPICYEGRALAMGVVVDITDRNHIERLQTEFIATVSHEWRTPLTSISGALALMTANAGKGLSSLDSRLLTIARTNCQRLAQLINSILDTEKIETGKVVFAMKTTDIPSLVDRAIESNEALAEAYGVKIVLDVVSTAGEIRTDPVWLVQVFSNLISNAVKFSPTGEEVVVCVETIGGHARVSVRDHGPGIPDDFKSRIFEKFAQADASDARQQGGAGLGLNIVKQIVTRLGGEVGFGDAPGGGTIFQVDLPGCGQAEVSAPEVADAPSVAVQ